MELKKYEFYLNFWLDENFCDFYNKGAKIFDALSNLRNFNNSTPKTLTMKTLIAAAIVLSASTLFASAGTNLYDTNNWYGYRGSDDNTTVSFASAENSITISGLEKASYAWGYFSPTILATGQTLSISGTIITGTIASDGKLMLGLFNSGNCSQDQMVTRSYKFGIDVSSMANYVDGKSVPATATGGMTGVFADYKNAYSRTNATAKTAFLVTTSAKKETFATEFTQPTANTAYAFSYVATKTEKGVDLAVSFNNETAQTASFETEVSTFDVLGIRSPVTSGGSTIKLSNLSMTTTGTVAPEPAMFGLLAGTLALVLAGTRRRRR